MLLAILSDSLSYPSFFFFTKLQPNKIIVKAMAEVRNLLNNVLVTSSKPVLGEQNFSSKVYLPNRNGTRSLCRPVMN